MILPTFAELVTAAALGAAVTLACGVGLVLAYGPWRVALGELEAERVAAVVPVWPSDRAADGEHRIVREQLPEEVEFDAYHGTEITEARRIWHQITDNPPARGTISWYLPNGKVRAHVVFDSPASRS